MDSFVCFNPFLSVTLYFSYSFLSHYNAWHCIRVPVLTVGFSMKLWNFEKWRRKGSHSSSVSGSNRLMWLQTWKKAMGWCTAQWKMLLFCAKTIVKESRKFELARLKKKKKKKEKHFGRLVTFWFGAFAILFSATGCVFRHENTRKWMIGCHNGL